MYAVRRLSEGEKMEYPKIDIRDICGALGITYCRAFPTAYYLNMIYKLSLMQRAAEQKMHLTLGESAESDSESNPAPKQVI